MYANRSELLRSLRSLCALCRAVASRKLRGYRVKVRVRLVIEADPQLGLRSGPRLWGMVDIGKDELRANTNLDALVRSRTEACVIDMLSWQDDEIK
jgi:hypothetical protein